MNDCAMVTVRGLITVAAGVLAPGHLGELTRYLPSGLAGAVIGGKGERSEVPLARKLVPLLRKGMLLADRACDAGGVLGSRDACPAVRGSRHLPRRREH